MSVHFGPAGNSVSFAAMGYKKSTDIPEYVVKMGLNAYEYQCGRGVKISDAAAAALGEEASARGVQLSLHSPYYISLSSVEEEKRQGSINYILQSAQAVSAMGGVRVVVHSGSAAKLSREQALVYAKETLKNAAAALDEQGYSHIRLCPETMGKINQLGTLDEVIELCGVDERFIPCIDFGHLNARTMGGLRTFADYEEIFTKIENGLGLSRLREFHAHFSKIEYTEKGGEKRHLTFEDRVYGPDFEPVAELIAKKGCSPTIICESDGTQAEDAKTMRDIYETLIQ
ncbi:MAG: TIM barrel protein [Acetanaerobacterium sp.]